MKKLIFISTLIVSALAFLSSCGAKDPVKETEVYNSSLQKAKQTASSNPSFAEALNKEIARAEKAMKATESITQPEAKAKAIRNARNILTGGLFSQIKSTKESIARIKELNARIIEEVQDTEDILKANAIREMSDKTVASTEAALSKGATDVSTATNLLKEKSRELNSIINSLENILDQSEEKRRLEEAAQNTATTTSAGAAAPSTSNSTVKAPVTSSKTNKVAPQWACKYCKGMNKSNSIKCVGCGAPKTK